MSLFSWEVKKLFRDSKIAHQVGAIALILILLSFVFRSHETLRPLLSTCKRYGFNPGCFINVNLFCRLSMTVLVEWILPIFVISAGVNQFAVEEHEGTFKTLLSMAHRRTRIFFSKFLVVLFHVGVLCFCTYLMSFLVGIILFGRGELIIGGTTLTDISEELSMLRTISEKEAFLRHLSALPFIVVALLPVAGLAILVSSIITRPTVSDSITLSIFYGLSLYKIFSMISGDFLTFGSFSFTSEMFFWNRIFLEKIPWDQIFRSASFLLANGLSFVVLAWGLFRVRDFKN